MADPFTTRLEVRLSDTDAQGHMASAAYVAFASHALWACVRAAGVDIEALLASGVGPVNLETTVRYLHELRGGDQVDVSCQLTFDSDKTYRVAHELRTSDGEVAATVIATFGLLDLKARRLVPDPASLWRRCAERPELLGLGTGANALVRSPCMKEITLLQPEGLVSNPAFSHVAIIPPGMTTIHVGGQNAVPMTLRSKPSK